MLPIVAIITLAAAILSADGASASTVTRDRLDAIDARVVLPAAARPKQSYVRFYLPLDINDADDLPFTTMVGVPLKSQKVIIGLFIIPGEFGVAGPPGVRPVDDQKALPYAVHGECLVVNVIAHFKTGETLGSWCNVYDGPPRKPRPAPSPVYLPNSVHR